MKRIAILHAEMCLFLWKTRGLGNSWENIHAPFLFVWWRTPHILRARCRSSMLISTQIKNVWNFEENFWEQTTFLIATGLQRNWKDFWISNRDTQFVFRTGFRSDSKIFPPEIPSINPKTCKLAFLLIFSKVSGLWWAESLISTPVRALQQVHTAPSIRMFSNSIPRSAAPLSQDAEDNAWIPAGPCAAPEFADQQCHWGLVAIPSKKVGMRKDLVP